MKLKPIEYSSNNFSWSGNTGVTFITDLCGQGSLYRPLYDDACDVGFEVRSVKTDRGVTFVLVEITQNDPREWVFHSVDGYDRTGKYKIRVLNT